MKFNRSVGAYLGLLGASLLISSCGNGGVSNEDSARRAYLGIDPSIDRALQLGFDGFNAATSANIPTQMAAGGVSGTLTVTGQVDQGSSANKQMRLLTAYASYEDMVSDGDGGSEVNIAYTTGAALPELDLSLRGIPNGTFTGTFTGVVTMSGDLSGDVTMNLTFAGSMEQAGSPTQIRRVPGTTTITGTAMTSYGTFNVNSTR